jgi:hypothetical protein
MIKSKRQQDIQSLCNLHVELTDEEYLTLLSVYGLGFGPLLPEPVKRVPYDSLYVKLKNQRDF